MEAFGKALAGFGLAVLVLFIVQAFGWEAMKATGRNFFAEDYNPDPGVSTSPPPIQGPLRPTVEEAFAVPKVILGPMPGKEVTPRAPSPARPEQPQGQTQCRDIRNPAAGGRTMFMCSDDGGRSWWLPG